MLAEFFRNSAVGLAIIDEQLRYRMVNPYLAASNGTSIESHLGKHVDEILGEVGCQVAPVIEQVFANAQPVLNYEFVGAFSTKPGGGRWVDSFFPIADSDGRVKQVGAVVVELEAGVRLQRVHEHGASESGILRSWKDIARYLGACVKTVQRWENLDSLPVHRVSRKKGAVVFALRDEIDAWLRSRTCSVDRLYSSGDEWTIHQE